MKETLKQILIVLVGVVLSWLTALGLALLTLAIKEHWQ